jgi:uncharacterized protein
MLLQDIYIYPIKSLGGQRLTRAQAWQRGFEFDRRWMLIDDTGQFITQRVEHRLALLSTEVTPSGILVCNKHFRSDSIRVDFQFESQQRIKARIWDDAVTAVVAPEAVNTWFSKFLGKTCRLVHLPETERRPVDPKYAANDEQVSLADAFPYLLIGQASLDDLNKRLDSAVSMDRFRPNLVVSGTEAFEEDSWAEIRVGTVHFKVAKPCARCVLTTVDQDTAEKGREPLHTLSGYRRTDNKVLFGQNLIALNEGTLNLGDPVEVIHHK